MGTRICIPVWDEENECWVECDIGEIGPDGELCLLPITGTIDVNFPDDACMSVQGKEGGVPIGVTVTNPVDTSLIESTLDAILEALGEPLTVVVDGGTITIDGEVDVDFSDLIDWLTNNPITVNVDGTVTVTGTVNVPGLLDILGDILDALNDLDVDVDFSDVIAAIETGVDAIVEALTCVDVRVKQPTNDCVKSAPALICDATLDPLTEELVIHSASVYVVWKSCPGKVPTFETFSDAQATTAYVMVGDMYTPGDTKTLVESPEITKPYGRIVKTVDYVANVIVSVEDNNRGLPSSNFPIEYFAANNSHSSAIGSGATFAWQQDASGGWSPQFIEWTDTTDPTSFVSAYAAALGVTPVQIAPTTWQLGADTVVNIGCGAAGCGGFPGIVQEAADAGVKTFARHLSVITCDPDKALISDTITATDHDPDNPRLATVGHTQDSQPTPVEVKFCEVTVCDDAGVLYSYLIGGADGITMLDPRTLPPRSCWERCPIATGADSLLESVIEECPCGITESVTSWTDDDNETDQSFGIGVVGPDGQTGIKYDTSSDSLPAGLKAVHDAIIACIGAGNVATVTITDQDGNMSVVAADEVYGDGNPQYVYGGSIVDGDPAGGKIVTMSASCPSETGKKCLRTSDGCPAADGHSLPTITPACPVHGGGSSGDMFGLCSCEFETVRFDPNVGRGRDRITLLADGTYEVFGGTTQGIMSMLLFPGSGHPAELKSAANPTGCDFVIVHFMRDGAAGQAPGDTGWLMLHADQILSSSGTYALSSTVIWDPSIPFSTDCLEGDFTAAVVDAQGTPTGNGDGQLQASDAITLATIGQIVTNGSGVLSAPVATPFFVQGYQFGTGGFADVGTADHYPGEQAGICYKGTRVGDCEPATGSGPDPISMHDACTYEAIKELCAKLDARVEKSIAVDLSGRFDRDANPIGTTALVATVVSPSRYLVTYPAAHRLGVDHVVQLTAVEGATPPKGAIIREVDGTRTATSLEVEIVEGDDGANADDSDVDFTGFSVTVKEFDQIVTYGPA